VLSLKLALLFTFWFSAFVLLRDYAALALPREVARQLSVESYLCAVQLLATTLGGVAAALLLRRQAASELGLVHPGFRPLLMALLLSPALYVAASYLAVQLALPTVLVELRRGGSQLVRQNAGEVGRALLQAPLSVALLWAVVASPIGEEFLFRGALWSAARRLVESLWPSASAAKAELPEGVLQPSRLLGLLTSVGGWLRAGGVATLLSAAVFGYLHSDLSGGQGIIRVVATTSLGLGCGLARQQTGSLWAPIAMHMAFNTLALAGARRWIVTESFPTHLMVPSLATLLAGLGVTLALLLATLGRRRG
jgi:membrane protease YdiL (CAAX protease family)